MSVKRTSVLALVLWIASIAMTATGLIYSATHTLPLSQAGQAGGAGNGIVAIVFVGGFATVGALLAWKRPSNAIGWLMSVVALVFAWACVALMLAYFPSLGTLSDWFGWIWLFGIGFLPLILLLFPTGTLPSRRWRVVVWIDAVGITLWLIGNAFAPSIFTAASDRPPPNPIGVAPPMGNAFSAALALGLVCIVVAGLASIVSLVVRYRRADPIEREQLKWLVYVGGFILLGVIAQPVIGALMGSSETSTNVQNMATLIPIALVPIAIGIAIFRYRLYDIDVVISKTVVFVALATFITVVYVGVVVGIGALFGAGSGRPDLTLSIVATAVVALAFGAVRERVQGFANRLVYGRRATPYQALSTLASRMGTAVAVEDLLPTMARTLAEGTGASDAAVWLVAGDDLRPEAMFPDGAAQPAAARVEGDRPIVPGADLILPVGDHGELLGALSLSKPRGERLTPLEHALAADLAAQAGLVLRNVRLTEELLTRMREVRGSRQRIVSAQDAERRRLERNIHDGAQQELVAMAVRLRLAKAMLERDPSRAVGLLGDLADAATAAAGTLRELASGIYPSKLAEQGLGGALQDQAARAALPTVVDASGIGRYPPDQEAAVYFSVLEALQNVAKYAGASRATVSLAQENGSLSFEIADDGRGFDRSKTTYGTGLQGIADRMAAIGGELHVRSAPGEGTTVAGRVPAVAIEHVGAAEA